VFLGLQQSAQFGAIAPKLAQQSNLLNTLTPEINKKNSYLVKNQ
jgi:hypothetical protein